jgi:HAD superfamily hydrolase (TIGR01509 family)
MAPLPDAVLWDLDGTLVNSEPYWMAAETELVAEHGGTWTYEDGVALVGLPLLTAARILADHGVPLAPEEIVEHLVGQVADRLRDAVPWQPGALEILAALADAGVPCALVTMSYRVLADAVTAAAPAGLFRVVVCGDEVTHGKPHPEPYLRAAELLGVDVTRCVAVEDSRPGIASALASGARTVGVEVVVPVEPAPGLSRVASLEQLGVDSLRAVVAGQVLDLLPA